MRLWRGFGRSQPNLLKTRVNDFKVAYKTLFDRKSFTSLVKGCERWGKLFPKLIPCFSGDPIIYGQKAVWIVTISMQFSSHISFASRE
jgi:hypothetical protein